MENASPSLFAYFFVDLRIGFGRAWWLAKRTALIAALLLLPLFASAGADADAGESAGGWLGVVVVVLGMDIFYALWIAASAAIVGFLWRLFGVALLVATLLAPLVFFGVLSLLGPWVVDLGQATLLEWSQAIASSPQPITYVPSFSHLGVGGIGHAGPAAALILLVILLPALLIALGNAALILVTPPVLWSLLGLIAAALLVVGLSLGLSVLVSAPLLLFVFVRRLRRRHREHTAAALASAQDAPEDRSEHSHGTATSTGRRTSGPSSPS